VRVAAPAVTREVEMGAPGSGMAADIAEQPGGYARLLATAPQVAEVARVIADRAPAHVVFVARGTSDHAAIYGSYLAEIRLGLPAGLASPSTMTLFGARPDFSRALVVGVSQSGRSPDLVRVLDVARRSGATTLAVTNAPDSELAATAELHVDVRAGRERAVAATKTYTAELLALLLVVEGVRTGTGRAAPKVAAVLDRLPDLAATTLDSDVPDEAAIRLRFAGQLLCTGRTYGYPTAREAALKIIETSYLSALAYSGADILHGPVAVAAPAVPVVAVVGAGPGGRSMAEVLDRVRSRSAEVIAVSPAEVPGARIRLPVPEVAEEYSPLLDILPLQRLALRLALERGGDPDAPRGLTKVTHTR
jgi:glucosamine--fructose-6-phosphate aminotransferase (isomerizing)